MRRLALLTLCAALAACADSPNQPGPFDPSYARGGGLTVEIVDPPPDLLERLSAQLAAEVTNRAGRTVGADVTWSSSAPEVASVSADGLLEALLPGTAEITASVGANTDAFVLTVIENPPPVAGMEDPVTDEDTPVVFQLAGTDEYDPPESLRAWVERGPEAGRLYQVDDDGAIDRAREIVGDPDAPTLVTNAGRLVGYDPPPDASGSGASVGSGFTYHLRDPLDKSSASHSGFIDITPVDDPPVALDDAFETDEDVILEIAAPGVLDGDTDVDGDVLSAAVASGPFHGTLALESDGSFAYAPTANFHGTDSFTYEAADGTGLTDVATVTIVVIPVNDPPVSDDDAYDTDQDARLDVAAPGVLGGDIDVDGDALTATLASGPSHGTLALSADGSFTYQPDEGFHGTDAFTYVANDGAADGDPATVTITVHQVNQPPVAVGDDYEVEEDRILEVAASGVLANDTDAEGAALTATLVDGPSHGAVELRADGSFTYTPEQDFFGTDGFTYRADDGAAASNTATVAITVTARNDRPVIGMEDPVGIEDTPVVFRLVATDVDDPVESLTVFVTESPIIGKMYQVHEDGTVDFDNEIFGTGDTATPVTNSGHLVAYVPPPDLAGEGGRIGSSFVYFARDPHGAISRTPPDAFGDVDISWLGFVDITNVNDAPVAAPTVHEGFSDLTLVGLTLDFHDVDVGDNLTGHVTRFPEHGRIYRSFPDPENEITPENPTFKSPGIAYAYELNSVGEPFDSFEWYVTDRAGERSETVEDVVNIVDRNDPPNPVCADGTEYDATGHPIFESQYPCSPTEVFLEEDAPNFIILGATDDADDDGQSIRFAILSVPENGRLRDSSNQPITDESVPHVLPSSFTQFGWKMSFFPDENYNTEGVAPDSLTFHVYDVRFDDETNQEVILDRWPDTLTMKIHVTAVNDAPIAGDDAYQTDEDAPLHIAAPGVLENDTDVEAEEMSAVLVSGPSHGSVTLNADGSFGYTPDPDFHGTETFTYRASDGAAESNTATVTLTVRSVDDGPPVSQDDAYESHEDVALHIPAPGVLANDADPDGDPMTATLVGGPAHGSLELEPDGSFVYTPDQDFDGADAFDYSASDGIGSGESARVTITVHPNEPPVANSESYATDEDSSLQTAVGSEVLWNDTDADGDPLTAVLVSGTSHGTISIDPDGTVHYSPDEDFTGHDTFTYKANDGITDGNTVTDTILVLAVNDAPVAGDDAYETDQDTPLIVAAPGVLANDTDVDGDALRAALATHPSNGSLVLEEDGSFRYEPDAGFHGTDTFTYQAKDGDAASNTVTVTITVHPGGG